MRSKLKHLAVVGGILLMGCILSVPPHANGETSPPKNHPVCDLNKGCEGVALPPSQQPIMGTPAPEMPSHNTAFIENFAVVTEQKPKPTETYEKEESDPVEAPPPKPAQPPPPVPARPAEPQMGDTRMLDGQKQVYFLGFGWIEDSGEPKHSIYAADMYENGNKIGILGGGTVVDGDGDINKIVGIRIE